MSLITLHISGIADINIGPPVPVNIGKTGSGGPFAMSADPCLFRDILKFEISFVQVEHIGSHVGGKKDIHKPVVVYITNGHSSSIVKIPVGIDIEFLF